MDVFEAVQARRSIRSYQDKPVEEEQLQKLLEAARLSPSAVNRQPCEFIVIQAPEAKQRMQQAYPKNWFFTAPLIIVACADPQKAWQKKDNEEIWKIDAAIALQSLVLTATAQGLGTCWVCAFDEEKTKEILGIPSNIKVVAMTPVGYPAEEKGAITDRKPVSEMVHYNRW
ncbi:MAG: nitroreductase family protein [Candidatus Bathyarchaeota archaeon]|nr:nitroreductase family protein [Candidatus Bathyarchaeota archaeon]